MGARFSKNNQNSQYPYGAPYAVPYPPPHKPFVPPYGGVGGFGHTMFPQPHVAQQGFIPPSSYGTAQFGPPPLLNWLPQEKDKQRKKRKSRRTQSEKFVGGFAGEAPATQSAYIGSIMSYDSNPTFMQVRLEEVIPNHITGRILMGPSFLNALRVSAAFNLEISKTKGLTKQNLIRIQLATS